MKASAWGLVALLLAATTLNYLDRQTLSILAPQLQQELGLDNRLLGILFSVFYYTYTLAQFAVGPLLDRMNLRKLYGGAVVGWSAAAGLTATASGFGGLLFWRMLLGAAESANWPAALRLIQRALPPEKRNLANGIFTSGTSIGALIAPLLVLELSSRFGWRMAFVGVASLGLLWFAVWFWYSGKREFRQLWRPAKVDGPKPKILDAYRTIFSLPKFWFVFGVSCLVNPCLYFLLNWLPTYLTQAHKYTSEQLRWPLTYSYLGLDAGYMLCGIMVTVLAPRWNLRAARGAVMILATCLLGASAFVAKAADPLPLLVTVNCGAGIWIASYLTMAQEVSAENTATAAGLLGGSGSLAGALAMWGIGEITNATGSFELPYSGVAVAGSLALLLAWRWR